MFGHTDTTTADEGNFFPHTSIHQTLVSLEDQVHHKTISGVPMVIGGQVKHSHTLLHQFQDIHIHRNAHTDDSIGKTRSELIVPLPVPAVQHDHARRP